MNKNFEARSHNRYIGWVPCVSGKLLFNFTTCDAISKHGYINANNVELDSLTSVTTRYLIVSTKVNWKDIETNADGLWNVVLIASAPLSSKVLTGKVYLVPSQNIVWDSKIKDLLKDVGIKIKDKEEIQSSYEDIELNLDAAITSASAFGAKFELKESGMTFLTLMTSSSEPVDKNTEFLICRQCYYYIKYTFHKDKHHAPSESLTTVHHLTGQEITIGLELLGDLKDALVALKRNCEPSEYKTYFSSKGILSYCKSLAMSCKKEGFLSENDYLAEKVFIDSMGESLEVTGKKIEAELQLRANFNVNFRSICLFALAIIAPFTIIFRTKIEQKITLNEDNKILNIISWVVSNESHVIYTAIFVLVIYFTSKYFHLRYGSLNLALGKANLITKSIFAFVVDDIRSAEKLLSYAYFFAGIIFLYLLGVLIVN